MYIVQQKTHNDMVLLCIVHDDHKIIVHTTIIVYIVNNEICWEIKEEWDLQLANSISGYCA